jgi:hypothetical protein
MSQLIGTSLPPLAVAFSTGPVPRWLGMQG